MTKEKAIKCDDNIHPQHYNTGQYKCIDVMVDIYGKEAVQSFCKCNALKYIWRMDKKGGIEDAQKAIWYLEKYVDLQEERK